MDLMKLFEKNPTMSEAKNKEHPVNRAIAMAKVRAYGKNPHTKAEEVRELLVDCPVRNWEGFATGAGNNAKETCSWSLDGRVASSESLLHTFHALLATRFATSAIELRWPCL